MSFKISGVILGRISIYLENSGLLLRKIVRLCDIVKVSIEFIEDILEEFRKAPLEEPCAGTRGGIFGETPGKFLDVIPGRIPERIFFRII